MALAVDSFEHLVKEISFQYRSLFRLDFKSWTVKDVLAAVGTGYVTYKALVWSCKAYAALKEYGISRLAKKPSLVRTYGGTWAGEKLRQVVCVAVWNRKHTHVMSVKDKVSVFGRVSI